MNVFDELYSLNVNCKTEKKATGSKELTYLSWTWAWEEVKKRYPEAHYEIIMHNGLPYVYDENTGYMVFTNVTIEGITHMMWLPVMDSNNRAMKSKPYKITFKNGKSIDVEPATMFDINKTIMRCLVKNLAMFGLGLYIYAGEDLPEAEKEAEKEAETAKETEQTKSLQETQMKLDMLKFLKSCKEEYVKNVCEHYNVNEPAEMTQEQCMDFLETIKKQQEGKING